MKQVKVKLKDKNLNKKFGKIVEQEVNQVISEKMALPPEHIDSGIVLFRRKRIEPTEEIAVSE